MCSIQRTARKWCLEPGRHEHTFAPFIPGHSTVNGRNGERWHAASLAVGSIRCRCRFPVAKTVLFRERVSTGPYENTLNPCASLWDYGVLPSLFYSGMSTLLVKRTCNEYERVASNNQQLRLGSAVSRSVDASIGGP